MANNILGYIGIENAEIILYLSQILTKLGKKVLLIDYSTAGDLTSSIPVPEGLSVDCDVIRYLGIDFTKVSLNSETISHYDDILINYGFQMNPTITFCTRIEYVTDQQKFNADKLASLPDTGVLEKGLLIKEAVESKISQDYILDKLQKGIKKENVTVFDLDVIDIKYKILTQYNTLFGFRKITKAVKEYLKNTIRLMYPGISAKEVQRAFTLAERGR